MTIDNRTFGSTPAAMYLADRLNVLNNAKLTRKVSTRISNNRQLITQLLQAESAGYLTNHTVSSFATTLRERIATTRCLMILDKEDQLVIDLMTNVMIGDVKRLTRMAQLSKRAQQRENRARAAEGVKQLRFRIEWESDNKTPDVLIERSKKKLARLGKPCLLY